MDPNTLTIVAAALGLPTLLGILIKGLVDYWSGKPQAERARYKEIETEIIAWKTYGMDLYYVAVSYRARCVEAGVDPGVLGEVPKPPGVV